jgi:two-component system, response regulator PdtaR
MALSDESIAVLVAEDEPLILMDVAATIREEGFRVYEAANADEAIGLLAENSDIRALFTDVDMPGSMDGVMLAHYAHSLRRMIIVVTSGQRNVEARDLPPGAIFFEKPCRPDHLVATLRETIESER